MCNAIVRSLVRSFTLHASFTREDEEEEASSLALRAVAIDCYHQFVLNLIEHFLSCSKREARTMTLPFKATEEDLSYLKLASRHWKQTSRAQTRRR